MAKIKDTICVDTPEFEDFIDFEVGFEDADPGMLAWTEAQLSRWGQGPPTVRPLCYSYDYVLRKDMHMACCEDYPCCGHTDGLGCNYVPDMDYYYARAARMDYDDYYDEP